MIISLIFIIIILIAIGAAKMGFFEKINFTKKKNGPYKIVYDEYIGHYKNTGIIMDKIFDKLKEDKIDTFKGFGIYYDNPKKVPEEKLRSISGCVIEEKDYKKLEQVKDKYKIKDIESKEYMTTEFPYYNKLSVIFSLMKVYPAMRKFEENKKYTFGAVMEIYDVPHNKIIYNIEIKNEVY